MTVERRLLTYKEAAECMGNISEDTIRNLVRHGRLPVVSVGSKKMIPVKAIDWYIDETAELGDDLWRTVVEEEIERAWVRKAEAETGTGKAHATAGKTGSGSDRQLYIADGGSRG